MIDISISTQDFDLKARWLENIFGTEDAKELKKDEV